MKRHSSIISLGLVFILWFGLASKCNLTKSGSGSNSNNGGATPTPANRFVGTWKPAPGEKRGEVIDSFTISADGTFVLKSTKPENKPITGTYTMTGETLTLVSSNPKERRDNPEVSITDDGRLKMTVSRERDPMYFVRK